MADTEFDYEIILYGVAFILPYLDFPKHGDTSVEPHTDAWLMWTVRLIIIGQQS